MSKYIYNPKTEGSGIIGCIPQKGTCPNICPDCFFQNGRSYLEPLEDNLPNIPSHIHSHRRVVRINDGNDSNVDREEVEMVAQRFDDCFFNTSSPERIGEYPGPVVLTVDPIKDTFIMLGSIKNLMFVRLLVKAWNIDLIEEQVEWYTGADVKMVLTYMAYFNTPIVPHFKDYYEWKERTLNSYWCLKQEHRKKIELLFVDNPFVYSCGYKGTHDCKSCGNCLREYYRVKEVLR